MSPVPFRERVFSERFPITYEAISPRGADVEKYLEEFERLPFKEALAGVNVTNNPSARIRIDPMAFGHLLLDLGVDPIPHLTCRDDTLPGIQRWLFGAWALGMRNVVVMTGDHPKSGDYPEEKRVDSLNAIELIHGIKHYLGRGLLIPDVTISGGRYSNRLNPPKPPKEVAPVDFFVGAPLIPWRNQELSYARAKVEAGVQFFQTQITWEAEPVLDFLEEAQSFLRGIPVLVGTAPLRSVRTMEFMHTSIPHVRVPPAVQKRIREAKDPGWESVEIVTELVSALKDGVQDRGLSLVVGLHVLPINDNALAGEIVRRAREV